jgi:hypothetical protein
VERLPRKEAQAQDARSGVRAQLHSCNYVVSSFKREELPHMSA